jgi:hypothetical protein
MFTTNVTDMLTLQEARTLEVRRARAIQWLGTRWVLHPAYQPRLPAHGSTLDLLRRYVRRNKQ